MRPGDFAPGEWGSGDMGKGRKPTAFKKVTAKWFHTCKLSNETIWPGQEAWMKTYFHYYTGEEAFSDWLTDKEYMLLILKGEDPNYYDLQNN